jgi:hypothetical protein
VHQHGVLDHGVLARMLKRNDRHSRGHRLKPECLPLRQRRLTTSHECQRGECQGGFMCPLINWNELVQLP